MKNKINNDAAYKSITSRATNQLKRSLVSIATKFVNPITSRMTKDPRQSEYLHIPSNNLSPVLLLNIYKREKKKLININVPIPK